VDSITRVIAGCIGFLTLTQFGDWHARPFVASNDGIAAGEPAECFNPNAAVMCAEALSRMEAILARSHLAAQVTLPPAILATPRYQEIGHVPDDLSAL